ncbi:MAG: hypothetical protein PHY43_08320 [Verrucomicrobiales bacterium]|nr:hypothetical protein [Verrucomicrobiales bacterium]
MKLELTPHVKKMVLAFIAVLVLTGGIELWMGRSLFGPDARRQTVTGPAVTSQPSVKL